MPWDNYIDKIGVSLHRIKGIASVHSPDSILLLARLILSLENVRNENSLANLSDSQLVRSLLLIEAHQVFAQLCEINLHYSVVYETVKRIK